MIYNSATKPEKPTNTTGMIKIPSGSYNFKTNGVEIEGDEIPTAVDV